MNRPLTEDEQKLRNDQRCIGCGQKVEGYTNYAGKQCWPYNCGACVKHLRPVNYAGKSFGSARAHTSYEFRRRMSIPTSEPGPAQPLGERGDEDK